MGAAGGHHLGRFGAELGEHRRAAALRGRPAPARRLTVALLNEAAACGSTTARLCRYPMLMQTEIAVLRFGLGARPGELATAASDPQGWLRAQPKGHLP